MVQTKYSPEELLNKIRLNMMYDSSKTLNENELVVKEQTEGDLEYFKTAVESIMNKPDQVSKLNFGTPTVNIDTAVKAIKKSVEGMGTDFHGLDYILEKGFNNISNSMEIIKKYPSIGGESLYSALNGEWFAGFKTDKIVTEVAGQLMEWCSGKKNISICKPKTKDELKYGKI